MKRFFLLILMLCAAGFTQRLSAQEWAIKSNLLYDATTSINLGVERAIADKWTIELSGNWNPFEFKDNKKWKHWLVQPEVRYWTWKHFWSARFSWYQLLPTRQLSLRGLVYGYRYRIRIRLDAGQTLEP